LQKKKNHKAYFALAKICSSTALLVLSMTFFCYQELCSYKFCALNLSHTTSVFCQNTHNTWYKTGKYPDDPCIKFQIPSNNIHYLPPPNQKLKKTVDRLHVAIYVPQKYYPNKIHTFSQIYYHTLFQDLKASGAPTTQFHV